MRKLFVVALAGVTLAGASGAQAQRKSALEDFQFDGVTPDSSLKRSGMSRQKWLSLYPVQAKEYWDAWDCKDKKCDSKWKANIRSNAALIPRPKGNTGTVEVQTTNTAPERR